MNSGQMVRENSSRFNSFLHPIPLVDNGGFGSNVEGALWGVVHVGDGDAVDAQEGGVKTL